MSSRTIFFALAFSIVLFVTVGLIMTGAEKQANANAGNAPVALPSNSAANLAPSAPAPGAAPAQNNPIAAILAAPAQAAAALAPAAGSCGGSGGGCGCGARLGARPANAPPAATPPPVQTGASGAQLVSVRAETYGYDHPAIQVEANKPVEFHFSADPNAGCGRQLILDGFNVNLVSQGGAEQVATFTPTAPGTYNFHCGMNMWRGTLTVV